MSIAYYEMEHDDTARIRAIRKCLVDCGQEVTEDAIATQFHYETGREMPGMRRQGHVDAVQSPTAPTPGPHPPVDDSD